MRPVPQLSVCPACDASLAVSELTCTDCGTSLRGSFVQPPLTQLTDEQQRFIETFVLCRGVIRDVERALAISYPTVRARLDTVVAALTAVTNPSGAAIRPSAERRRVLDRVALGELSAAEAAELLRSL